MAMMGTEDTVYLSGGIPEVIPVRHRESRSSVTLERLQVRVQPARKHYGPPEFFKNESKPRGAVFIANFFSVKKLDGTKLNDRIGSDVNVNQLKELFSQMQYEVVDGINDTTKEDTLTHLHGFRDLPIHRSADSMVVIIMSHAIGNEFYTSDGGLIHYLEVCEMFSNKNCPALNGKPKIFLFQFCRRESSKNKGKFTNIYSMRFSRNVTSMYVYFSTVGRIRSDRYEECRALFIYHVCKVFMDNVKDQDLNYILKELGRNLSGEQRAEFIEYKVTKKFHFNPPLEEDVEGISVSTAGTNTTG